MTSRLPLGLISLTLLLLLALVGCSSDTTSAGTVAPQATAFSSTLIAEHSNKCLDLKGGSFGNGTALEQESCTSSEAPEFDFVTVPGQADTYLIKNKKSQKCLDIFRAQSNNGAKLIQYRCGEGQNQQFKLVGAGNSYYQLIAQHSGKCVDVYRAYKADGTDVTQYSCQDGAARAEYGNQLWKIAASAQEDDEGEEDGSTPSGAFTSTLTVKHSGKCLDLKGGSFGNGTALEQESCTSSEGADLRVCPGR